MPKGRSAPALRVRDGHEARVSNAELFFDLVYVFAVTQLSHHLLGSLTATGAIETLVMWFGVWLVWQYVCWMTNWFDPEATPIRLLLFTVMLVSLLMAASIPGAFAERGLTFGLCIAVIHVGQSLFLMIDLGKDHELRANYQRILVWSCIAGFFWVAGGLVSSSEARLGLWIVAVACLYISPMIGFRLPFLGRSLTSDWTIEGGHLAERCQLFVIVALGEAILVTGATLDHHGHLDPPTVIAFLTAFLGSIAMWWMYFDLGSEAAVHRITTTDDPGRIGAIYHYIHVIIIAGIIVTAVGNDLVIAHPAEEIDLAAAATLIGGPAIYLFGNALYKNVIFRRFPPSHVGGLVALAVLWFPSFHTDRLMIAGITTLILIGVAIWEARYQAGLPKPHRHGHGSGTAT